MNNPQNGDMQRGLRWRSARETAGYTQAELATKISELTKTNQNRKVTQQAIALIEKGGTKNPWFVREAAMVLGKSPAWLQFGAEEIDKMDAETLEAAKLLQELDPGLKSAIIQTIKNASIKSDDPTQ